MAASSALPWLRTGRAMALLALAGLLVALVPFERWRGSLGLPGDGRVEDAKRHAADVDWAARRLPMRPKCLPRAMALSWLLRRRGIGHAVVMAVRPPGLRAEPDALHAWVEAGGERVLGDLPGPWVETLRIGG